MNPNDTTEIGTTNEERDDDDASAAIALREKLLDALIPGYQAEFDPDEADMAGAFVEDAMSEQYAAESSMDLDLDLDFAPDADLMVATMPVAANDLE